MLLLTSTPKNDSTKHPELVEKESFLCFKKKQCEQKLISKAFLHFLEQR